MKLDILKDKTFDLLAHKDEMKIVHDFDAAYFSTVKLPSFQKFQSLETHELQNLAKHLLEKMKSVQDLSAFQERVLPDLKSMHASFNDFHPPNRSS